MAVRLDAPWTTTPAAGSRNVYRIPTVWTKAPKVRGRAVREHRIWTAGENGCHKLSVPRKRGKSDCINPVMHGVESPRTYPPMRRTSIDSKLAKLFE